MSDVRLTDPILRAALLPEGETFAPSRAVALAVSERTRSIPQSRSRFRRPWRVAPDATRADARMTRLVRLALVAALLASLALGGAVGARLLAPRVVAPQLLLMRGGALAAVAAGATAPVRIARLADRFLADFNVSPDGSRVATLTQGGTLELWDAGDLLAADAAHPTEVILPTGVLPGYGMDWMYDGRSLVLKVAHQGARPLYLVDAQSGRSRPITPVGLTVDRYWPSPDSHRVAVVGQRSGSNGVWIVDADTGETRQVVDRLEGAIPVPAGLAWSPGSRSVVMVAERVPGRAIWLVPLEAGGLPTRVTDYSEYATDPTFSPDGAWIVYTQTMAGDCPVALKKVRPDGTGTTSLLADAFIVGWDVPTARIIAETDMALEGAPFGAIVSVGLDGDAPRVIAPLEDTDLNTDPVRVVWACHPHGLFAHWYGGYSHR